MSKTTVVNSDDKKRYIELYSLMNEATHLSLNTKKKFKNLIVNEECYIFAVFVLIVIYVVAYWRQWSWSFFVIVLLMVAFEVLAIYFLTNSMKKAKELQNKLANKTCDVAILKTMIKVSQNDPAKEETIKKEDIRAIYVTRYNIVIMPLAHAENSPIYLDKSCFSEIHNELDEHYPGLVYEIK